VRQSNHTNHYGFIYWEIGNECYGDWETDNNPNPHDPYTYAFRAADYIRQMKEADAAIQIGVVATSGENGYSNAYSVNHPAFNPRTGATNYGWTPIMLSTLKALGAAPDFLIEHNYPESSGQESDPLLLQYSTLWPGEAANLRQMISDYFGTGGTNIELFCTENNSGSVGRQSTSLVNGLYYADSRGQLMQTEFNAFVWWDFRNGPDTTGNFDPTLYGWRTNGDMGMVGGLATRYPPYYAAKLAQYLAQPGGTILSAASDYPLLAAYAARQADGAVSLLVLNKDTTTNFNAQISLTGFVPSPAATLRSFGIPQDDAARTNGPTAAQDIATNTFPSADAAFDYVFPPLSMTLFTLAPTPPGLVVAALAEGQLSLELQGQPGVRYVIQSSPDLWTWTDVSTNTLTGYSLTLTNPAPSGAAMTFWRAVWR
jgi:hypothetical protein